MNEMWKRSFTPPDRSGLTLVEVVAGLALLVTLLVSILMAFGLHASQIRSAKDRLEATAVADKLLTAWMAGGTLPTVGERELIDTEDGNTWWRIVEGSGDRQPMGLHTIKLEIVQRSPGMQESVLTSVELFVMERPPETIL